MIALEVVELINIAVVAVIGNCFINTATRRYGERTEPCGVWTPLSVIKYGRFAAKIVCVLF